jgi:predicted SnoaL-like aldol condensation-catalyzing enzyme
MSMNVSRVKLFVAAALLAVSAAAQSKTPTAQEKTNLKLVQDWWKEVITFHHVENAAKYASEDMIQHNPNFPNGLDTLRKLFGSTPVNPMPATLPKERTPVVEFAKGDYVVMVFEHEDKDPGDPSKTYRYNSFDAFRIEGGKIKEHWDGAMKNLPRPAGGKQ